MNDRIDRMSGCIRHRGPDSDGRWIDPEVGIALGHRRLAIVDLSEQGMQPMTSASGRFVTVFNGEIYNYRALRDELEFSGAAPEWRGTSDTEVMLAAIERWGISATLPRLDGMFSLAIWDRRERALTLARDRAGEKPLYYGRATDGTLVFGSELKALASYPSWGGEIDRGAIAQYLRFGYVPSPMSIYRGISKLPPGTSLCVPAVSLADRPLPQPRAYWTLSAVVERVADDPLVATDEEAVSRLDALLRHSVALQMVADVPLGAFLSGGIDSSLVVALMQAQSDRPVQTFTIGFGEDGYDEAQHARVVARHLGTDHTELYVTAAEAIGVVSRLPRLYDEPFADSSQIPTFLVAALARRKVTVSLSGDAGDELFGGYNRYFWGPRVWRAMRPLPLSARRRVGQMLHARSTEWWDRVGGFGARVFPARLRVRRTGEKVHKLADALESRDPIALYERLVSIWEPHTLLAEVAPDTAPKFPAVPSRLGLAEAMMYLDFMTYLPDDILAKVDRACMGVSLEGRVPFLDPSVIEFAWRLPLRFKIRDGQGKWILRTLLARYVPPALFERPKMGFALPVGRWLRGPLRDWAEDLLEPSRMQAEGVLRPESILPIWRAHLSGARDHSQRLWVILMLQAWMRDR